jgi:3'(2'), 5'-bisphosphate nucleotidase
MPYAKELRVAALAVQRATILTQKVFHEKAKGTLSKDDRSPVTIGDFGAQALIIQAIKHNFPEDEIVAEEEASTLRSNPALTAQIWDLVKTAKLSGDFEEELGGSLRSVEAMLQAIDAGNSAGGPKGRIWALDPIDGTKGYLRGGQYAVCLALIEDGEVKVGVLGCPNLPIDDTAPFSAEVASPGGSSDRGVLFSAVLDEGARSAALGLGDLEESHDIFMKSPEIANSTFCESVDPGHSSHGDHEAIRQVLGITGVSVRMDSQAKYGSIARGAGDIYLRLPVSATYQEKIWDHAAGDLIVREAGGYVTDVSGNRLDFGQGRTLLKNKGVVAAPKILHPRVLEVVREVLAKKGP